MTSIEHDRLIAEYEERIQVRDVLLAFRFLVEHSSSIEGYRGEPRPHGYIPSFRYLRGSSNPFSFIINRASLLFYFRRPGLSHPAANASELRRHFEEVKVNRMGEIQVRLSSLADAKALVSLVFPRSAAPSNPGLEGLRST